MNATTAFFRQVEIDAERRNRLRGLATAGSVEVAPERRTVLQVRGRIMAVLAERDHIAQGDLVTVTAAGLAYAPLMLRVTAGGRFWMALHTSAKWAANTSDYLASLTYEINEMPF